jgi:hypothetical protein
VWRIATINLCQDSQMRLLLLFLLCVTASNALAQREITAITVNYASPEQLVSVIAPLLSEGSSVRHFHNKLILNATPQELAQTRELLQQLDKAGRQLLVSVRTDGSGSSSRSGVDVDTVVRSGDVVIRNDRGGHGTESRTTITTQSSRGTQSDNGNQAVRVTEGMPAYIATGISAPTQSVTVGPGGQRHYQQDFVSAVAGFYATTWLNGETVRISIDQSNDQFEGRTIATQQLRSEVSGALGQWLPLGVVSQSASRQDSGIGSRGQSGQSSSTQLFIRVEALE